MVKKNVDTFLISGDKGFFKQEVIKTLDGRVLKTKEFIYLLKRL
jgi:hypothetical protein